MAEEVITEGEEKKQGPPDRPSSVLTADIGHSNTRVALFDLVDGQYHLVARGLAMTTNGSPYYDVAFGFDQAIQQLSLATGRTFLNGHGQLIRSSESGGSGIDYFGATTSIGDPLRVLVAGLLTDISITSARRALRTSYAFEVDCFSFEDTRDRMARIDVLLKKRPELILLTGGTNGGADQRLLKLIDTLVMAIGILDESQRPPLLFAGNINLQPYIKETLGELTRLYFADNVRPEFERESLDSAITILEQIYLEKVKNEVPGLTQIADLCSTSLRTTAHTSAGVAEYLVADQKDPVLFLDIGLSHMSIAFAGPDKVDLMVRGDLGQGKPMASYLDERDLSDQLDWVFPNTTTNDIQKFLLDRRLKPSALPANEESLRIEHSIMRDMLGRLQISAAKSWYWSMGKTPSFGTLLIRGGAAANSLKPRQVLLAFLDAFQPTGSFRVAADENCTIPAMGLLAAEYPELVVQVLANNGLDHWGFVIVPSGNSEPGQVVLEVKIETSAKDVITIEVPSGGLEVIPLPLGESAEVTLTPADDIDVGFGTGISRQLTLNAGKIGLAVDARGRPLPIPADAEARKFLRQRWIREFS